MGLGGFSVWQLIIVLIIPALIIWSMLRAVKKSSASSPSEGSTETAAYQAGRRFRRTIESAYTKSREKSDLEARGAKYDALAKLKALQESGVISDAEFEAEKTEILRR